MPRRRNASLQGHCWESECRAEREHRAEGRTAGPVNPAVSDLNRGTAVPEGVLTPTVLAMVTEGASMQDTQSRCPDGYLGAPAERGRDFSKQCLSPSSGQRSAQNTIEGNSEVLGDGRGHMERVPELLSASGWSLNHASTTQRTTTP